MSIASEITRLQGIKSDILNAIADKGVTVPSGSALADCTKLIGDISTGGGGVVLPKEYKAIEYIRQLGNGNQTAYYLIDLGEGFTNENKTFGVVLRKQYKNYQAEDSYCSFICLANSASAISSIVWWYNMQNYTNYAYSGVCNGGTGSYFTQYDNALNYPPGVATEVIWAELKNRYAWNRRIDGDKSLTIDSKYYSAVQCRYLKLFGTFEAANAGNVHSNHSLKGNIYKMYIKDANDSIIHYFAPCIRISDNKIGFYDVCTDIFYEPQGDLSTLTAGPDLQSLETSRKNIITAINGKGVTVPGTADFSDFAGYINQIEEYDPIDEYEPAEMPDGRVWTTKNLYVILYDTLFGNNNYTATSCTSFVQGSATIPNIKNYGLAYNFNEVLRIQSNITDLFPGWSVPTKTQMQALVDAFGGNLNNSTFKLQTNSKMFSNGEIRNATGLWTRTSLDSGSAYSLYWQSGLTPQPVRGELKASLLYVRLIKDL